MKQHLLSFAALTALFVAGCCQNTCNADKATTTTKETSVNTPQKALVVYFSASGNTKAVASRLAQAIGADLQEIKPAQPYTAADLNWQDKKSRSSVEMADRACRPAIQGPAPDLAAYDIVYVGFPIWWYREPSIIDTFVESNAAALAGKTIVPFATSGGSGMGDSSANLQKLAPAAKVVAGRRFPTSVAAKELADWAQQVK